MGTINRGRRRRVMLSLLTAVSIFMVMSVSSAMAAVASNTNDSGAGSLRQAILDTASGGTVTFDNALSGATIRLASTLTLSNNVTIDGSALPSKVTISGDTNGDNTGDVRIFTIGNNLAVTLKSLVVTRGLYGVSHGGAIYLNAPSTLTVDNCSFSYNSATFGDGGAIYGDGYASITITNSSFVNNTSSRYSGAVQGQLTISNSTFSGNSCDAAGGALYGYGTITNSIITGNTAGSGIGGAVYASGSGLTVTNSIFANSIGSSNCAGTIIDNGGNTQYGGTVANSCGATIPTTNSNTLITHLPLDGSSVDLSGNNKNGVPVNNPTYTTGRIEQGASFSPGYFDLPAGYDDFTGGLTIAVWAKPNASGSFARFVELGTADTINNISFGRDDTTSKLYFSLFNGAGIEIGNMTSTDGTITNNEWHHYAVTHDGAGKAKLYKDGVEVASKMTSAIPVAIRSMSHIGKSNRAGNAIYSGKMDDVRIYNRALASSELVTLYNMFPYTTYPSATNDSTVNWSGITELNTPPYSLTRTGDGTTRTWTSIFTTSIVDNDVLKHNTVYNYKIFDASDHMASITVHTPLYYGWNIIGIPYDTTGLSIEAVLGSAYTVYEWVPAGASDPDNNGSYFQVTELTPGKGYFIKGKNSNTVLTYAGSSNPATVIVTLKPGYNKITNTRTTAMTSLEANWLINGLPLNDALTASKIGADLYWWNGSAYNSWKFKDLLTPADSAVVEPWKAYWILNMDSVDHTLTIK